MSNVLAPEVPAADGARQPEPAAPTNAIVTASYAPDLERCRMLCETIDRHVSGFDRHYILVESRDVPLFRSLESSRRVVVDERDLLPSWLHPYDDPLSRSGRRVWLSARALPLRGWHVQQLRRIAIARHVSNDALVFCDSDVAFVRPFDCGTFWRDGRLRLFRRDNALVGPHPGDHKIWSRNAGIVLGISEPTVGPHDYISTVIAWHRATVDAMCKRIEDARGRNWVAAVAARRKFSECIIYGRFVDEVQNGAGHFHASTEYCRVQWSGKSMSDDELRAFVVGMADEQVAIGVQSFIGVDTDRIRRLIGLA